MNPIKRRTVLRIGVPCSSVLLGIHPVTASLDGKGNDILTGIDDVATIVPSGRSVTVAGNITCEGNQENVDVSVEIAQESTSAKAEGRFKARCTGDTQDWTIRAPTRRGTAFEVTRDDDPKTQAEVHAFAQTRKKGHQTDSHEWWNRSVSVLEG